MKGFCCTMGMCCGSTVELSGLNLGSGSFRNVDEISIQGSVCAEWFSSEMNLTLVFGSDTCGGWGLILTILVNGCELSFGVFRSGWILEILSVCFFYIYGRSLLLWFVKVCVYMFSMIEAPPKGEQTSGILYYYHKSIVKIRFKLLHIYLVHIQDNQNECIPL